MKSLTDLIFGPKVHEYEEIDIHTAMIQFSNIPGDLRKVRFVLKEIHRARRKGPKWAEGREFVGYLIHWHTTYGIPIKNTKDGYGYARSADFAAFGDGTWWRSFAEGELILEIESIRHMNGFYWEGMKLRANND